MIKPAGIILLILGIIFLTAALTVQILVNNNDTIQTLNRFSGIIGGKVTPAFVQELLKNERTLNTVRSVLTFVGIKAADFDRMILYMHIYAVTPYVLIGGCCYAVAGLGLTIFGIWKKR